MTLLEQTLARIRPVSPEWLARARERLDNLTKPRGSLGMLEELAARVTAIREEDRPSVEKKEVFVFVGDHGVASAGVSAYPQEVTGLMVRNFLGGGAAINVLARCAGAAVTVVDVGMKDAVHEARGLLLRNVRRGTANIAEGPAMTRREAEASVDVGIELAGLARANHVAMVATGEMGIGNTTPSSALFSVLLGVEADTVTGKGTGLDREGVRRKAAVIEKAVSVNRPSPSDPLGALAAVGGLEIAGICGLCLGGAAHRMIVVVDGFISTAGALTAMRLHPAVKDYLFFSHRSSESGHGIFFEREGIRPILDLDMRLGEGTGAALGMQVIESAVRVYNEMATFADVGIAPGA